MRFLKYHVLKPKCILTLFLLRNKCSVMTKNVIMPFLYKLIVETNLEDQLVLSLNGSIIPEGVCTNHIKSMENRKDASCN